MSPAQARTANHTNSADATGYVLSTPPCCLPGKSGNAWGLRDMKTLTLTQDQAGLIGWEHSYPGQGRKTRVRIIQIKLNRFI